MDADRCFDFAVLALATSGSGALSLWLGQDINYDLRHYHFYVGYALVDGRLDRDIAPAGLGTYLNPLIHVLHYLGMSHLPPRLFGFLLGAVHGLNAFVVYRVARVVLPRDARGPRGLSLLAGALAMLGANALALAGTTCGDNLVSIPALLALFVLVEGVPSTRRILLTAVLGGAATGLKLTMATYHIALAATIAVVAIRSRSAFRIPALFALGSLLGFLGTSGYWSLMLWERFGNPVFPLANYFFRSPFFSEAPMFGFTRWAAKDWVGYFFLPLDMATGAGDRLQEVPFHEARFLAVLLGAVGCLLSRYVVRLNHARVDLGWRAELLLVYWFTACVVWAVTFHYYRYLVVGELLAPVALFVLLHAALPATARIVSPAVAIVLALTTSAGSWGRRPWRDEWFRVRVPSLGYEPNAIVLVDAAATTFVIPFFPREHRFFGVFGQMRRLEPRIRAELAGHRGPVLRLGWTPEPAWRLEPFGLAQTGECGVVRTGGFGRLHLCRLTLIAGSHDTRAK